MIEVEHLTKRFGSVTAIEDVSFRVEKGQILGFLGPNGAGKSTTMRILAGFFPASEGRATVAGFDVFEQPLETKKRVGYLPEHPPLYPEMSVDAYLKFTATIKAVKGSAIPGRIAFVKERCGLQEWGGRLIKHLSKGYRQRVGLAQALIHDPEVLILDEPTVGLDPKQIIEVRELIRSLAGDHTVILSTHILPEVGMTCEKVIIITQGRITAIDTPQNLTSQLKGSDFIELDLKPAEAQDFDELSRLLSTLQQVRNVSLDPGSEGLTRVSVEVEGAQDLRPLIARTAIEAGFDLYQMQRKTMTLEEIFLELTTEEPAATEAATGEAA